MNTDFADEIQQWFQIKSMEAESALDEGKYNDTYFKWTLSTLNYKAQKYKVMGRMTYPKTALNEALNKDQILEILNANIAFDFDYEPKEGDFLKIEESYQHVSLKKHQREYLENFISFKFESGRWAFGNYPIEYIHTKVKSGKMDIQ